MASQENEKAMDGLLRRSLARDAAAERECPDTELLAAYYERSLGADEAAGYELHFSQCTRCRQQLAAMARAEAGIEIENPAGPVLVRAGVTEDLPVAALAAAQSHELPRIQPRPRSWLSDLRWLAPVAAAIILTIFIYMRLAPSHPLMTGQQNQVAMSRPAPLSTPDQSATSSSNSNGTNAPLARTSSETAVPEPESSKLAKKSEQAASTLAQRARQASAPPAVPSTSTGHGAEAPSAALQSEQLNKSNTPATRHDEGKNIPVEPAPAVPSRDPSSPVAADATVEIVAPAPAPAVPSSTANEKPRSAGALGGIGGSYRSLAGGTAAAKLKTAKEPVPNAIQTPDPNVLYRIASGGFVERSQDAGATWQRQNLSTPAELTAGSAPSPNTCWLVGRSGVIFMTDDGKNWKKVSAPLNIDLVSVAAKNAVSATVTAGDGQKWSTQDAGNTWSPSK